jgi:hypothetical protein
LRSLSKNLCPRWQRDRAWKVGFPPARRERTSLAVVAAVLVGPAGPEGWRRARAAALRLFQRCGLLPHRKQDNLTSPWPRHQDHGAGEKPQGWKASLALHFLVFLPSKPSADLFG